MPQAYVKIDGRQATLDRPDDDALLEGLDELRAAYDNVEVTGVSDDFARSPAGPSDYAGANAFGGLLQGGIQGATFGFGDEIGAAVNQLQMSGGPVAMVSSAARERYGQTPDEEQTNYEILRDEIRAQQGATQDESPWAFGFGEFGGALGATAPLLAGGATGLTLSRLGPRAGLGIGEGALYGLGLSEGETAGEQAADVGIGAGIGGTLAAIAPPAFRAAGRGLARVANRIGQEVFESPEQEARRVLQRALERDEVTPGDAQTLLEQTGGSGLLADLSSETVGLAETLAQRPGGTERILSEALESRQLGQQGRIAEVAEREIGQNWPEDFRGLMGTLSRERQTQAGPLYDRAYSRPVRPSAELQAVIDTIDESYPSAFREAERLMTAEGPQQGSTVELLDYVGRALSDKASAAYRSGSGNEARIIRNLKRRLDEQLYESVPELQAARNVFAGAKQLEDAAETGRGILTGFQYADEVADQIRNYTPSEMDAFRIGSIRGVQDKIRRANVTHNATRRLLNSAEVRDIMRLAFPDEDAAERFFERMYGEETMSATRQRALFGSPTARRLEQQADIENIGSAMEVMADTKTGGALYAARRVVDWLKGDKDLTQEGAIELANLLTEVATPDQVERLSRRGLTSLPPSDYMGPYRPSMGATALTPLLLED